GCGIPAEDVDRIFTPFFSSRPSGTGLGLSLVAKIVRVHGGRTNVRSAPGSGTCFTISLPVDFPAPNPSERRKTLDRV
ncbi:MAG: hypothetical protein GY867_03670, partial [bacterium]|nr:hypothetical protein [bacterium]